MPLFPTRPRLGRIVLAGCLALSALAPLGPPATAATGPTPANPAAPAEVGPRERSQAQGPALEPGRAARIRRIIPDPDHACLAPASQPAITVPQVAIEQAAAALALSPVGAWLVRKAGAKQVLVCLDAATKLAAYYRAELRLIGLQAALGAAAKVVFLAHELAHVLQHPAYSNDRSFPVEDLLLMHRVREATAEAIATRVLWQLRAAGRPEPWQAKLATGYRDIARAFAQAMNSAPARGAGDGRELRATLAAFERWFVWPERLRQYDDHMLDHVERIARDRLGLTVPRRSLTDRFLRGIGWHAGESFLAAAPRALTAPHYRAGISADNSARLAAILGSGAERLASDAAKWQDGATARPDD
jgi:hypothetical protein